ncbi:MAG: DNA primase [Acidobacteria bacterium]|nr:MAG: DNA primase [Acidobacteriota bacterium]
MIFSQQFIQELKSRIDVVELVGSYITLTRAGSRMRALCPFHQEKTPSFYISPETGLFHCFGCHAAGDIISFVQQIENFDFNEAIRFLAERYGVPLEFEQGDAVDRSERDRILEVLDTTSTFFSQALEGSKEAKEYLNGRDISQETVRALKIGFAPESGLLHYLEEKGFNRHIIEKAGLLNDQGREKFRNRLMFPIQDLYGKVVGFGGRILRKDTKAPKYLNSPATPVFEKKRMLYGLNLTRDFIRKTGFVVLVEGYMDFAALYQHGVVNVAAALGTSFTENHAILLKRFARKIYLCFDADTAGMAAALRSFKVLAPGGLFVYGVTLPGGEDPDSFVRTRGKEDFMMLLDKAVEIPDFLSNLTLKPEIIKDLTLEEKLNRINAILDVISVIPDRIRQSYYVKDLSTRLGVPERNIATQLHARTRRPFQKREEDLRPETPLDHLKEAEKGILLLLARQPGLKPQIEENREWLERLPVFPFLQEMLNVDYERVSDVIHRFSDELNKFLTLREQEVSSDAAKVMRALKRLAVQQELNDVKKRLEAFQEGLTETERDELLKRKEKLAKEFHHL